MTKIDWTVEKVDEHGTLTRVDVYEDGWSLSMKGLGFFADNKVCQQAPAVGENCLLVGGLGQPLRGIEIGGRCYRYVTEAEQEVERLAWIADEKVKKQAKFEAERAERDAEIAAMPSFFRERIARFQRTTPDWRREHEPYEIFVCKQAIVFWDALKTVDALQAFAKMGHEKQRFLVPAMSDEHSGNTFGMSVRLAHLAMTQPELLPKMHGALCSLVGCADYGCYAAYEGKAE